jgi:hypothetical protein
LSTRQHQGAILPDPAPTTNVAVLVANALTKLRSARLAEVETLSALIAALVESGTQLASCGQAAQTVTSSGPPSPSPTEEVYLSVRQLAERVPYAEHTIRNLMTTGALHEGEHYFKRRGRVMFSWPAMRRWVEERGSLAAQTLPMVRSRRRGC